MAAIIALKDQHRVRQGTAVSQESCNDDDDDDDDDDHDDDDDDDDDDDV